MGAVQHRVLGILLGELFQQRLEERVGPQGHRDIRLFCRHPDLPAELGDTRPHIRQLGVGVAQRVAQMFD